MLARGGLFFSFDFASIDGMSANAVTISATFENGEPLAVLSDLIRKRQSIIRGETTRQAVIATAINIMNSLKGATKKAPLRGNRKMYTIERTNLYASYVWKNGHYRRVVRNSPRGAIDWNVTQHCRDLVGPAYNKADNVSVFKMQLFNENCNNTLYYAYARTEADARNYMHNVILARMLKKEAGMAQYAIGIAQAKVSGRPMATTAHGSKQFREAYEAAWIETRDTADAWSMNRENGFSSGEFWLQFTDKLRYSALAVRGGTSAVEMAYKKAANRTFGIIHNYLVNHPHLKDTLGNVTPFPEAKGVRIR